jgi:hypothetical protein
MKVTFAAAGGGGAYTKKKKKKSLGMIDGGKRKDED